MNPISESSVHDQLVEQLIGVEKNKMRRWSPCGPTDSSFWSAYRDEFKNIFVFVLRPRGGARAQFHFFWKSTLERHQVVQIQNEYITKTQWLKLIDYDS